MPLPPTFLRDVVAARIYDVVRETPLDAMPQLSARLGHRVLVKREDLQPVFSFKLRGALHKIASLPPEDRARGVIAASAGNHAQGVALAAQALGLRAVIVMPETTPEIKVDAVRARGVETILHGDAFDAALAKAKEIQARDGLTFIPPYDDPTIIAGQGTLGLELHRQAPDELHAVFLPVGGGGLAAGVAGVLKSIRPDVHCIAVEPADAACFKAAREAGAPVTLPEVGIFADGVAVARIGEHPWAILRECIDEVVTVSTDEICAAVKDLFDDTRSIAEPAGAVALAGLKRWCADHPAARDRVLATIHSGANMNFDRLRHIAERTEIGEKREAIFAVDLKEQPGALKQFCYDGGQLAITEFNYRYDGSGLGRIFIGFRLGRDRNGREALTARLRERGYTFTDLTDDEVAKIHIRHLVGGHIPPGVSEELYGFTFPERPGALLRFLEAMGQDWSITCFHYRNHGSAYGRVLVGLHVPEGDEAALQSFVAQLGYRAERLTAHPSCRLFLGPVSP